MHRYVCTCEEKKSNHETRQEDTKNTEEEKNEEAMYSCEKGNRNSYKTLGISVSPQLGRYYPNNAF